jgi:hypothetical protein
MFESLVYSSRSPGLLGLPSALSICTEGGEQWKPRSLRGRPCFLLKGPAEGFIWLISDVALNPIYPTFLLKWWKLLSSTCSLWISRSWFRNTLDPYMVINKATLVPHFCVSLLFSLLLLTSFSPDPLGFWFFTLLRLLLNPSLYPHTYFSIPSHMTTWLWTLASIRHIVWNVPQGCQPLLGNSQHLLPVFWCQLL